MKKADISKSLEKCGICSKYDLNVGRYVSHIFTERPGERFAVDLLEVKKGKRIINGVDYFSRMLFSKYLRSKEPKHVIEFLEEAYRLLPFLELITDNGREFQNAEVEKWCEEKNVKHTYTIPYYHASNGRIERLNRTVRTALKKVKGSIRDKLPIIVNTYNNQLHRALKMSPVEALREENHIVVKEYQKVYAKEFKTRKYNFKRFELVLGEKVLVRNENKVDKMNLELKEEGFTEEKLGNNTYAIGMTDGRRIIRHASQLRSSRGDVGCGTSLFGVSNLDDPVVSNDIVLTGVAKQCIIPKMENDDDW